MRPVSACLLGCLLVAAPVLAQTSFPMITHANPVAAQRGTTTEIIVEGQQDFAGAYQVLVDGIGVTAEIIKDVPKVEPKAKLDPKAKVEPKAKVDPKAKMPAVPAVRSVKLKVKVAPDAPLGSREFRIATPQGISSLGQLLVCADPVIPEKPGIDQPSKALAVPVPSVVCGRIKAAENVDFYKVTAKAGQVLTFDVHCARIQDKIHDLQKHADPLISVSDASGRELAASDDLLFADPLLTFPVPKDGEYFVQIRDAKYDGDPRWVYALSITDKPYVLVTYPMAANPGQTFSAEPSGSAKLAAPTITIRAPAVPGIHDFQIPIGRYGTINPTPLIITPLPLVNEQEPNDDLKAATRVQVPGGANGRIQARRDLDCFVFKGQKGKPMRLEVFARRFGTALRSRIDAAMDLMYPDGRPINTNDDTNGKDPMLIFTPTVDGDYIVRIRDLNNKGGDGFVYYLEIDNTRQDFTIKCDPSKAMIGPGSRTAWYVQITRSGGFDGPVKVDVSGLPKGVTVNPLTIPANMTVGCLVVSAKPDAEMSSSMVRITGTAEGKDESGKPITLTRQAIAVEEIYFPGGGRGRFDVDMQAASVTNPSDLLEVQVKPTKLVLKPGEEVKIDVTLKRRSDFDKGVSLDVILRHLGGIFANPLPPGVTMVEGKSKTLLGTGNVGHITLKVAADAPDCTDVPICVQGFVAVNFVVKIGYASEPIFLTVKK